MAAKIRAEVPDAVIELIQGKGGVFNVTASGVSLWNKREMGNRFPNDGEIVEQIRNLV